MVKSKKDLERSLVGTMSQKTVTQKVIYNINGEDYEMIGRGSNGKYQFSNVNNGRPLWLNSDQYLKMTGGRSLENITSKTNIIKRKLNYENISDDGNYVFVDKMTD